MQGYDDYYNLLLPPRNAGDDLPVEVLEFYKGLQEKQKKDLPDQPPTRQFTIKHLNKITYFGIQCSRKHL